MEMCISAFVKKTTFKFRQRNIKPIILVSRILEGTLHFDPTLPNTKLIPKNLRFRAQK